MDWHIIAYETNFNDRLSHYLEQTLRSQRLGLSAAAAATTTTIRVYRPYKLLLLLPRANGNAFQCHSQSHTLLIHKQMVISRKQHNIEM